MIFPNRRQIRALSNGLKFSLAFSRRHATLHIAASVGRLVCPSVCHIFEFRVVFALLLLLNCPRLSCRVSGLSNLWPKFTIKKGSFSWGQSESDAHEVPFSCVQLSLRSSINNIPSRKKCMTRPIILPQRPPKLPRKKHSQSFFTFLCRMLRLVDLN